MSYLLQQVGAGRFNELILADHSVKSDWREAIGRVGFQAKRGQQKYYIPLLGGINTMSTISQGWVPSEHNQSFLLTQKEVNVYQNTAKYSFNEYEQDALDNTFGALNVRTNTFDLYKYACEQAIAQRAERMALYGLQAGEGILSGASSFVFGNDSSSNSTVVTYDVQFFANKIMMMVQQVLNSVYNTQSKIVILTSNRIYNYMVEQSVPFVFGGENGGVCSILEYVKRFVEKAGIECFVGVVPTFEDADSTGNKDYFFVCAPNYVPNLSKGDKLAENINAIDRALNAETPNTFMDGGATQGTALYVPNVNFNGVVSGRFELTQTAGVTITPQAVWLAELQYQ